MKYVGSKRKYAQEFATIFMKYRKMVIDKDTGYDRLQYYVEPFVGSGAMIQTMSGKRIGNDSNHYLISLFKALQKGWQPPMHVTEEEYNHIKNNKDQYPDEMVAFVGFGCSFGSMWFQSYARGKSNHGIARNYADETRRNLEAQMHYLRGVEFRCGDYKDLVLPDEKCMIYCDSPYAGTVEYKDNIDHNHYYDWLRDLSKLGHTIFVSEYEMPDDFTCVWQKEVNVTISQKTYKKRVEKLFLLKQEA